MCNYKIRKTHKLDRQRIYSLLHKEVEGINLVKEIREHIKNNLSYKLQNEAGEVVGIFLVKKYEKHYSLSYFFLKEEVRRKPIALKFFFKCIVKLNLLYPIYIRKNKNYEMYSRYFTPTKDENILKFTGLRDKTLDDKYMEVFKWVEIQEFHS